ncbi:MAG: hypothetical protein ACM3N4_07935 [Nitrososphaerota archaeon]
MTQRDFRIYNQLRGKRVVIETLGMLVSGQATLQPERFTGVFEDVNTDGIMIRPDNGRLTMIFKHAILSMSEAVSAGATP